MKLLELALERLCFIYFIDFSRISMAMEPATPHWIIADVFGHTRSLFCTRGSERSVMYL